MKNSSLITTAVLLSMTLSACGGGSASSGTSNPTATQTPPNPQNSDELILNSGRGTVNNQDTEKAD